MYLFYIHLHHNKQISSSSTSRCAVSTDLPDPLSPPVSIVHCSREVFKFISCIGTVLLYIYYIARYTDGEIDIGNPKRNTLRLFSSGTKHFITFELKVTRHEERQRNKIFLCWLLLHRRLSTQPTHGARSAQSHLASPSSESPPSSSVAGTQLTTFSQISAHATGAWRHPNTLAPIPIWDIYFDISEWHILSACAWTSALMLHLTNPCAKQRVLSLTKPKGKIYKTKSHGNYIAYRF